MLFGVPDWVPSYLISWVLPRVYHAVFLSLLVGLASRDLDEALFFVLDGQTGRMCNRREALSSMSQPRPPLHPIPSSPGRPADLLNK